MVCRSRFSLLIGIAIALAAVSGVAAAQQAPGLGSPWPNATDQSRAPSFHAYRFDLNGVEYVQVNDAQGNPQLAVATGNGTVLVLPVGNPSLVAVNAPQSVAPSDSRVVYSDSAITISASSRGYTVMPMGCGDPVECTRYQAVTAPAAAPAAPATTPTASPAITTLTACSDPVECSRLNN